jgi:hypothetical protein
MSDTFIFAHDVSFNYPITNIRDILPVYTTDTILNIKCTTLDVSGSLTANNMSCTNFASANNINATSSSYININKPLQPTYTYNATTGTGSLGSIGYIYSSTIAATTISPGSLTTLVSNLNVSGGIYLVKFNFSITNTGGNTASTVLKYIFESNILILSTHKFFVFSSTSTTENITKTFTIPSIDTTTQAINITVGTPIGFNNSTTIYKNTEIRGKIEYLKIG